jgi:spermidine synthase
MTDTKIPRFLPILLAFCMFSTGASGLVNEYVLATITTYILGNSIEQFSMVIAIMMLMMGVSGFVQSKMSDNNLMGKFITVEIMMALFGSFAPIIIYAAFGYLEYAFVFIHYGFVVLIGFLIGFEIPLVMRIIDQQKINLRVNLTLVYGMDYVGAFIGALIWVKILLVTFPLTEISFIVAGFNFVVASLTISYFIFTGYVKNKWLLITVLILTSAVLVFGYLSNRDWSASLEQKFYDDPIIYQETTKYQHLVLTRSDIRNDTRLYINGNTQFSSTDEKRYHDMLVHPVLTISPSTENVLILGGGDGLALREVLKYDQVKSVTLVDLDPGMVEMAKTNAFMRELNEGAFDDARVHLSIPDDINPDDERAIVFSEKDSISNAVSHEYIASVDVFNVDADKFVKKTDFGVKWDTVIIDFPDPNSIELAKLYSVEFYKSLRKHITRNAFISIQATSPFHAKESYLSIGHTMEASGFNVLPYRINVPSFGDWGYYMAWQVDVDTDYIKESLSNIDGFKVETEFVTPAVLAASFAFGKGELETDKKCINNLMMPCLLHKYNHESWLIE